MTEKSRLLIVDDEPDLRRELSALLERTGYEVQTAADGESALALVRRWQPALIVLDVLMPPGINGRETLRRLRKSGDWTPVILLTQIGTSDERAMSLQEGADDYLNKPFDSVELIARIQAILRRIGRTNHAAARQLISGDLTLDRQTRQAALVGRPLNLTTRAFGVLEFLMLNTGEIVSRDRLLNDVWGWAYAVETRAVDVRIAEIRKALDGSTEWIETLVGQGYRFLRDVQGR
ncbi:MAG: response regulator transcription factor [Chloroflexota bacterium]|nr:response regulator transcription factor [Chloroflexota bacterium]